MSKERSPRLSKNTEELFWDKKAYKQCLWGYFIANGCKPLKESDYEKVWKQFNDIEADSNKRYESASEDLSSRSDMIAELRDEAMEIINARNFKQLRKIKVKINEGDYNEKQRKYLKKLYSKRRTKLEASSD